MNRGAVIHLTAPLFFVDSRIGSGLCLIEEFQIQALKNFLPESL